MKKSIVLVLISVASVTLTLVFVTNRRKQFSTDIPARDKEPKTQIETPVLLGHTNVTEQSDMQVQIGMDTEFAKVIKNAKPEDVEALYILGLRYEHGNGVDQDIEKAIALFTRVSELGDVRGQHNLALCYLDKIKDYPKGIKMLEELVEQGDTWGMVTLGDHYWRGEKGLEKDDAKAFELSKKAAELGDAHGQYALAGSYISGIGVEKDFEEALKWYRKIHEQNPESHWAGFSPRTMEELLWDQQKISKDLYDGANRWYARIGSAKDDPDREEYVRGRAIYFYRAVVERGDSRYVEDAATKLKELEAEQERENSTQTTP